MRCHRVRVNRIENAAKSIMAALVLSALPAASESSLVMPITQNWRYSTNNLDGVNWQAVGYAETGWSNASPALLFIEGAALPVPKNTPLPERSGGGPMLTYYFRTTFEVTNANSITSLTFSNLIDDGAVFYLNGLEIQRVGMAAGVVSYLTLASRSIGDATTFDIFSISGDLLTNLVTGNNVLAAEVHQWDPTSSDIVFGTALIASTNTTLIRGPYLQNGSHTNVTVRWRTDAGAVGRVRFGTNLANLDLYADELAITNEHEVNLTDLLPDTKYFYSIGTVGATLAAASASQFFLTSPLPGTPKPTRIWVLGDSGTANGNQVSVRNAYETFTGVRHTDLWLMLGDNAYPSGADAEYQAAVFNIYTNMLRKSVLWSTLGNHETYSVNPNGNHAYFDIFTLPKNGEAGGFASGTEHYYSFDYGNVHFVCLDSMEMPRTSTGVMAQWLTNDLANTTADWTIAFWHHPPYSKGSHNSDTEVELIEMRQNLLPILEAYGVDLVLTGHSHDYERSYLLDRHYATSAGFSSTNKLDDGNGREDGTGAFVKPAGGLIGHQGAVYAVCGSSGQTSSSTYGLNHPAMYISLNNLGSMVLDITSNRLDAKFLRENGTTNDWFTIVKVNYAPVASNLTFTVSADFPTNLMLVGSDINRDTISYLTNSFAARGLISGFNTVSGALTYTPAHGFTGPDSFSFLANDGHTNSEPATVNLNVVARADTNANGLPDDWEAWFGISGPANDDDGDHLSNAAEYWANTNPTNAASALRIISVSRNGSGHLALTWQSVGGTRYRVAYSDADANHSFKGLFNDIVRPIAMEMDPAAVGIASSQSFVDDFTLTGSPPLFGARYYRIEIVR